MTTEVRFERQLPAILEDLYLGPSPDYRDEVLATAVRTRQRPAWTFPGRLIPMDITTRTIPVVRLPLRQLAVIAVLLALLAATLAVYVGSQRHVPAPFGAARNGLIPYISNGDIYVGDPVTGSTRLLVTSPLGANPSGPGFSPDGTKMAFFREVRGPALAQVPVDSMWCATAARANAHQRIAVEDAPWVNFTPDGRHIAVIYPVDGTEPSRAPRCRREAATRRR